MRKSAQETNNKTFAIVSFVHFRQ